MGYCLSIQALWEKQIRGFLQAYAQDMKSSSGIVSRIQTVEWKDLNEVFRKIRGVSLTDFDEYSELDALQLLANVCRHGEGPSMQRLAKKHSDFWLPDSPLEARTLADLRIPRSRLKAFATAIESFWTEVEYIYNESIERKHPSLERTLTQERIKRAGRGRPWDPP
jgi:hypothetical protein